MTKQQIKKKLQQDIKGMEAYAKALQNNLKTYKVLIKQAKKRATALSLL